MMMNENMLINQHHYKCYHHNHHIIIFKHGDWALAPRRDTSGAIPFDLRTREVLRSASKLVEALRQRRPGHPLSTRSALVQRLLRQRSQPIPFNYPALLPHNTR